MLTVTALVKRYMRLFEKSWRLLLTSRLTTDGQRGGEAQLTALECSQVAGTTVSWPKAHTKSFDLVKPVPMTSTVVLPRSGPLLG